MAKQAKHPEVVETAAATLTIKDAAGMTPAGRKALAAWLADQAKWLVLHGDEYAARYRARYLTYKQV